MKPLKDEDLSFFNMYFAEDEDPNQQQQQSQQDPNQQQQQPNQQQQQGDPNQQQQPMPAPPPPPPAFLPKEEEDPNDDFEKEFPMDKDNTNMEQDVINFTNYQRLLFFRKFKKLVALTERVDTEFNKYKDSIEFDDIDDEKQQNIINVLLAANKDVREQIKFLLEKAIVSMNIDKLTVIFRCQVRKLNFIIDNFEMVIGQIKNNKDINKK